MASLRQAAQNVLDTAKDGIGWIVLWQEGKGWESRVFYPDYNEDFNRFTFEADELEELRSIFRRDPEAILVNSYYHNLGDTDCMTRDTLADALRWQYKAQKSTVTNILIDLYKMTKSVS